ncbi:hypothetical protein K435DRAFT_811673 [Dendrothele bispora CBS 962.96]|uniref:Uncharacterized protein n=1 Tax=Dendrothele bispora (strain CBS 962.96) TaxID=1314807 RepID=A0A4S8KRE8_DENBC|nr:hypothetical protein K435DRAFT_811673 [Dendrothele bispora CBS 962.96]
MTEASSSTTVILHGAWPLGDSFNSNSNSNSRTASDGSETTYLDEVVIYGSSSTASASRASSSTQATITTITSTTCTNSRLEEKRIMMYVFLHGKYSPIPLQKKCYTATLIKGALGYAIQLSVNSNDAGGGATVFSLQP